MSVFRHVLLPLALTASFVHPAVHADDALHAPTLQNTQPSAQRTAEGVLRRPLAPGVYQLLHSPAQQTLYVASAEYMPHVKGGIIYKLNPQTLETVGIIHTNEKNFGLAMDTAGNTLFVTHSVGGSISKIDLNSEKVIEHLIFPERSDDGSAYGPRTIVFDAIDQVLYVGGVGDPGRIWVVDPDTLTVKASIGNAGKWVTGLLRDPDSARLFAANGDGEVLVIDTQSYEIIERWKPAGSTTQTYQFTQRGKSAEPKTVTGTHAILLNLALDRVNQRLFVTDHRNLKTVLVLDARTGTVQQHLPVGESLDVLYHPERNALYLTHRERGLVSELDATSYAVRNQYSLPQHPNSLTLSPDGKQLFISIKTPFTQAPGLPGWYAQGAGSVASIDLP